jgi:hypothetical protein
MSKSHERFETAATSKVRTLLINIVSTSSDYGVRS